MGSLANSSSLQTTIQDDPLLLSLSAFSQLSLLTLKPSPRLRLMPTMAVMATALPTTGTVMAWDTTGTTVLMLTPMVLTDTTTARGPLRLRPPPLLSPLLMPTTDVTVTALPTTGTVMAWLTTVLTTVLMLTLTLTDTTTARGPLTPSPRPMPTTVIITDMAWPTTGTVMLTMATTATLTLPWLLRILSLS